MTPIRSAVTSPVAAPGLRCFGEADPLLADYHDFEWGVPQRDDVALLETLTLVGFQAGLSWALILHKRAALRDAFRDFEPFAVAALTDSALDVLAQDPRLIRNPRKIRAARANARAVVGLYEDGRTLSDVVWSHAPRNVPPARETWADVPTQTPDSENLAETLRGLGFQFLGPVNTYSAMQAAGLVNDHIEGCGSHPR